MNAADLEERVLEIVQDSSFEGAVLPFLNQCLMTIAGKYQLVTLDTTDTVDCLSTAGEVALPGDYLHGLYDVRDANGRIGTPVYYQAYSRFLRKYPDQTAIGAVFDVAIHGANLAYVNREDKTLTLSYFAKPGLLSGDADEPAILPAHLHEPLLANYAAAQIFNLIEDGIESPKTNTKVYLGLYNLYLQDLEMYTVDTDGPVYVQEEAGRIR